MASLRELTTYVAHAIHHHLDCYFRMHNGIGGAPLSLTEPTGEFVKYREIWDIHAVSVIVEKCIPMKHIRWPGHISQFFSINKYADEKTSMCSEPAAIIYYYLCYILYCLMFGRRLEHLVAGSVKLN